MSTLRSVALLLVLAAPLAAQSAKSDGPSFPALKYRNIGPWAGGRVSRAAGVPGDPTTYYAATASGGVWLRSQRAAATWSRLMFLTLSA